MAVKLKCMGLALFCTVSVAQGVRAENCRLSLSQSRIDYGVVHREALRESPTVTLGSRTLHLSVLCAEPSAIALRFTGAADGRGFRFGQQGRLRLSLKHALMDGRAVDWGLAHLPGEATRGQLLPGQVLVARALGKRLTAQVDVDTDLPADAFEVRYQTVLESQGNFELVSPAVPLNR
ncbi:hypothetical protein JBE38_11815 [Pseudomonas sp. ICBG1301]|uniref:hypothetical protein n=1 Tax=Pseudomonas sp. ICBG1301 TaxID=2795987 RepID=UPI001963B5D0|nr:hypothetical protein [Pseudomonas sp. ICBG1301]MBM9486606.1 hypothetical protein [Pseudomonas sp. ICBG1301]